MTMKKDIRTLAALLMAGAAFTACSDKDEFISEQPVNPTPKYSMTVQASMGEEAETRGLYIDGKALKVKWANTDEVAVFPDNWSRTPLGMLTAAASETGSTTLSGDLTGSVAVNDNLHLLFPRAEWSYTGQKGILLSDENSIEKKYDYALADVEVAAIDAEKITTTANANLASQQAIVKFILKNNDGSADLAANKLTISAASNKLVTNKSYRGTGDKTYYNGDGYYTVDGGNGGFSGEGYGNLVDNNLSTKWCTDGSGWYIEFHTASPIRVDGYMLRTAGDTGSEPGRNPKDWVLKGKNEGDPTWTTIDTKSNNHDMPAASNTRQDFDADAPGTYKYFRLEITANQSGGIMQLSEMQLFKYASYEMGTSYGNITVTPDAAASELTVALRNENAGADTYTLTATVGASTYTFEKIGVTFENGKYYSITVKMQPKKVSSITLNKSSINLTIGSKQTLSVSSVSPDDAVDKSVTWSSNATSVATVNATTGEVTAVAEGTATITATANDGSGKTATCSVTVYPAGTIVWDSSNCSSLSIYGGNSYNDNTTIAGVNLKCNADQVDAYWSGSGDYGGISFNAHASGGFTFTGKQFTKIEMTLNGYSGWETAAMDSKLGTGWSYSGDYMTGIYKVTWTGTAASVGLLTGADNFNGEMVKSIVFLLE